jgi:Fe-S cluster assembly protein SufD
LKIDELIAPESAASCKSFAKLSSRARMETVAVCFGAEAVELKYDTELAGTLSETTHHALFVVAGQERIAVDVATRHLVPECRSDVCVKGLGAGQGRGEFRGLVYVAPGAQQTEAFQKSRNLLLGEGARILTSPQLEIYADDVKCSHGATVGQLDDDAVYYMRQRGLSEEQARGLQLAGFVNDIADRLGEDSLLRERIEAELKRRL